MIKRFGLVLVTALAFLVFSPSSKAADLYWEWSFTASGQSAQGYFVTNGGPYTGPNPTAGTFNITNFIVAQTTFSGSLVGAMNTFLAYPGGVYNEGSQPGTGFQWNGSAATQFFRANGTLTNGSAFYLYGGGENDYFGFYITSGVQAGNWGFNSGNLTLQAVTTPVPEPSTWAMGVIGTCVTAVIARRRKARKN